MLSEIGANRRYLVPMDKFIIVNLLARCMNLKSFKFVIYAQSNKLYNTKVDGEIRLAILLRAA